MKLEDITFFSQWNLLYDNVNIEVGTFYENVNMNMNIQCTRCECLYYCLQICFLHMYLYSLENEICNFEDAKCL